jgi:hypothetical protein
MVTTQNHIQRPLGALQEEIEKVQFFCLLGHGVRSVSWGAAWTANPYHTWLG